MSTSKLYRDTILDVTLQPQKKLKVINIRLEREDDRREVENLTREAFWNVYRPGCTEHYVLHRYRSNPDFIPELDFVMEEDGKIIGQVMYSKAWIVCDDGREIPAWTFGPIGIHQPNAAVLPSFETLAEEVIFLSFFQQLIPNLLTHWT